MYSWSVLSGFYRQFLRSQGFLGVPRAHIGSLEVTHKDLLQVRPTSNLVGREVLQPCTCRVGKVQGEVVDDEGVTICTVSLTSKPVVLEP
jgi:hypothetical protein